MDASVLIAMERRGAALADLGTDVRREPLLLSALTVGELLVGVERADTAARRAQRAAVIETPARRTADHGIRRGRRACLRANQRGEAGDRQQDCDARRAAGGTRDCPRRRRVDREPTPLRGSAGSSRRRAGLVPLTRYGSVGDRNT